MEKKTKARKSPSKPPSRMTQAELYFRDRDAEVTRLLESYKPGVSNLDLSQVTLAQRLVALGTEDTTGLPLVTKNQWLEKEMARWEETRPKLPQKRVQDPAALEVRYQQKFMEAIKRFVPDCFEDLREGSSSFNALFRNQAPYQYLTIINRLRIDLVDFRLAQHLESHPSFKFDHSYVWGQEYTAFLLAQRQFDYDNRLEKTDRPEDRIDDFDESRYTTENYNRTVEQAFIGIADPEYPVLDNFFNLQGIIYSWAEKYNLKKDWLIEYAYYLIEQFSLADDLQVKDLIIGEKPHKPMTIYFQFQFESPGWYAAKVGETALQYKKRVSGEFREQLDKYLYDAARVLKLNDLSQATNNPKFESLKWLVYSTVRGWNPERIVERFFPKVAADKNLGIGQNEEFKNKKAHIASEIRNLDRFDLPIREDIRT